MLNARLNFAASAPVSQTRNRNDMQQPTDATITEAGSSVPAASAAAPPAASAMPATQPLRKGPNLGRARKSAVPADAVAANEESEATNDAEPAASSSAAAPAAAASASAPTLSEAPLPALPTLFSGWSGNVAAAAASSAPALAFNLFPSYASSLLPNGVASVAAASSHHPHATAQDVLDAAIRANNAVPSLAAASAVAAAVNSANADAAAAAAADEPEAEDAVVTAEKKSKPKKPRKRKDAASAEEGEAAGEGEAAAPKPKKPRKKRKAAAAALAEIDDDAPLSQLLASEAVAAVEENEPEIPFEKRTLLSILLDSRTGIPSRSAVEKASRKKAEREAKKKAADEAAKIRKDQEDAGIADLEMQGGATAAAAAAAASSSAVVPAAAAAAAAPPARPKTSAPQIRFVDGKLVISEESLVLAQAETQAHTLEPLYETSRIITSASYTVRSKCDPWTADETKLFFRSLQQYGTDFSFIGTMFPTRTRKQIKAKFKREERENLHLIDAALRKKIPIDEEVFHQRLAECNAKLEASRAKAKAEAEAERLRVEQEEEERKKAEAEEEAREKAAELEEEEEEEEEDEDEEEVRDTHTGRKERQADGVEIEFSQRVCSVFAVCYAGGRGDGTDCRRRRTRCCCISRGRHGADGLTRCACLELGLRYELFKK